MAGSSHNLCIPLMREAVVESASSNGCRGALAILRLRLSNEPLRRAVAVGCHSPNTNRKPCAMHSPDRPLFLPPRHTPPRSGHFPRPTCPGPVHPVEQTITRQLGLAVIRLARATGSCRGSGWRRCGAGMLDGALCPPPQSRSWHQFPPGTPQGELNSHDSVDRDIHLSRFHPFQTPRADPNALGESLLRRPLRAPCAVQHCAKVFQ